MGISHFIDVVINGEELTLYPISKLAGELGRSTQTIRKWEISGILPQPIFKDKHGRRLYSQEQIDAIVDCAIKSNLRQGYSVANTNFSPRVYKALEEINKKYK